MTMEISVKLSYNIYLLINKLYFLMVYLIFIIIYTLKNVIKYVKTHS